MMSSLRFEQDERHTLYLEYLPIIADHRPPIRSGLSKAEDSFDAWLGELQDIARLNIRRQLNDAEYARDIGEEQYREYN